MLPFEISPEEVRRLQQSGEAFLLLDVRENKERQLARIEPSLHIPVGEIAMRQQELDPAQRIVVYCHAGVRSANVANWLRQQGFTAVQSMHGGIDAWSRLAVVAGERR